MSHFHTLMAALGILAQHVPLANQQGLLLLGDDPLTIQKFFSSLYGKLTAFALALSTFFFAWAAILYGASGTGNERAKQHAQAALYAALVGLALALLAGVVAGLINDAASGT